MPSRPVDPSVYRREVETCRATIVLDRPWRRSATSVRGAVVRGLFGPGGEQDLEHVDWHQHCGAEGNRASPPPILYRVDQGRPVVWAWGPYAGQHAAYLARTLRRLTDPDGAEYEVESVHVESAVQPTGITPHAWHEYEVRQLYPSQSCYHRRKDATTQGARLCWAEGVIASGVVQWWAEGLGWTLGGQHPLTVHVHEDAFEEREVRWRGSRDRAHGFSARFTANALIPDGLGIGRHRSEGFGEIRWR